ncbi:GNAT family N-acetyltransferase [Seonamhaeicola sediminis]|uniref:GNAT family N-acetyltransferase n=1 Tax=Seonamhaeicola sediminis TaxID=2528206 RepID=A0A562YEZ0_9FLAO|nr:GNAT family N-acetyltransferase [Seonamhaeicola sediminis]TWO33264.1 GNAT family N-acetyltransferase [Seonamhaeicola sediminis]
MNSFQYEIIPYSEKYETALLALEKNALQGKWIQLEMVKNSFVRRSENFEKYQIYLAVDFNGELLGVLAASIVSIVINNTIRNLGYCYDVRVAKHARGEGLTKKMGMYAYKNFYLPNNVSNVFLTMKKGNKAVRKSAGILGLKLYKYPFSYLTIPTNRRLKKSYNQSISEKLTVYTPINKQKVKSYFYVINGKPRVWKTNLIYHLKIRKLHFLIKLINYILTLFQAYSKQLPKEGDELNFGILVYDNMPSKDEVNSILDFLEKQNIGYLLVACTKSSGLYSVLKPISINSYAYQICSTFPVDQNDFISLDVRCL